MAIDLSLYLQSEVSAGELIAECRKALQASPVREHTPEVSEARVDAERNQVLREAYNLTATKGLQFRLDTSGDLDPQMLAVLGASLRVLARFPGDAVLIYNGDVAYFLRRKGTLVLNSRDGMWGPERLALVHGDSVREDLVDLL
ncbi:MAG TPA: SitI3 family protein [Polyangiales bacterium]|jgi:hypothetical protein|nr:SitI3 family protein [Polyangiales bacterium]